MKGLTLWIMALAAPGSPLLAQNITGTWQGSIKANPQDLRIVIKISLEDNKLNAVAYSIDEGGQPIPASTIAQDGSAIRMTIAAIGSSYEGKLSTDGNSMAGTWQGTWTLGSAVAPELGARHPGDRMDDSGPSTPEESNGGGCNSSV